VGITKKSDYTFKHVNQDTKPNWSAAQTKEKFDSQANELRTYINDTLIPELAKGNYQYATSSTGTDAYAVTIDDVDAYTAGMVVRFKADVANTGACTLDVNSLGAKAIKLDDGSDPEDGYIQAGAIVTVVYNGTNFVLSTPGLVAHKADTANPHNVTPADIGAVGDKGGVPTIQAGLDADKPAAGTSGRVYIATDTKIIYQDSGAAWEKRGVVNWNDVDGKPSSFPPSAHKSTHASGGSDELTPSDIGLGNVINSLQAVSKRLTASELNNNTTLESGIYTNGGDGLLDETGSQASFAPSGTWWHIIHMHHYHNNGYDAQIAVRLNGGVETYWRNSSSGTWSAWRKIWTEANDGAGSGLDADLVKGKDGVWELQSGEVDSQFASPSTYPRGLTWDGTNLWNADPDTDKIYELNTSGTILNQFASPSTYPTGLAWDGANLWHADSNADKIYELNTSGTILSQFASPGSYPEGLAWDGANLWHADSVAEKIYELNTEGSILSEFASPSTNPRGLTWDGTNLWNADPDTDKIYELNTSGTILNQFASPGSYPEGLAWDGTNLWHADNGADKIYRITLKYYLVAH